MTLNLIEQLLSDRMQDHSKFCFAPGQYHRITCVPTTHTTQSQKRSLLAYISLSPRTSAVGQEDPSLLTDFASQNYWCWMELDLSQAAQRDRESLCLFKVDRVTRSDDSLNSSLHYSGSVDAGCQAEEMSVVDFAPTVIRGTPVDGPDSSTDGTLTEPHVNDHPYEHLG